MAGETLKNAAGLLAGYPDNVAGLITPLDSRNHVIADGNDVGFLEESATPYTLTLDSGVPKNIMADAPAPQTALRFWQVDGNRELVQSYAADGIPVEPGVSRLVTFSMQALVAKVGGGTTDYTFQIFRNGVAVGSGVDVELSNEQELVDFRRTFLYPSDNPETLSFRVTSNGTDLDITAVSIQTFGVLI